VFFVVVFVFAEEIDICIVLQLTYPIRDMSAVIFTSLFRKPLQWNYKPSPTLSSSTLKMKPLVLSVIPSTKAACL
jgi:hypothetical protein